MDEVLIRAGIFQGVEPHAAEALAQALEPAETMKMIAAAAEELK